MRNLKKLVASIVLAISVTACGLPPIASWGELLKIDPLKTDFNHAYVVMRLPDHIRPTLNAISVYAIAEPEEGQRLEVWLRLKSGVPQEIESFAASLVRPGDKVYAFALDDTSIQEAQQMQQQIAEFRRLGIKGEFQVGYTANADGMCYTAELSLRDRMSVWLKTSEMNRMVPLVENRQLKTILGESSDDIDLDTLVAPCL